MAPAATLTTPPPAPAMAPEGGRDVGDLAREREDPRAVPGAPAREALARTKPLGRLRGRAVPRAPKHGGNGKDTAKLWSRTAAAAPGGNRGGGRRHRALPPPSVDSGVSAILPSPHSSLPSEAANSKPIPASLERFAHRVDRPRTRRSRRRFTRGTLRQRLEASTRISVPSRRRGSRGETREHEPTARPVRPRLPHPQRIEPAGDPAEAERLGGIRLRRGGTSVAHVRGDLAGP